MLGCQLPLAGRSEPQILFLGAHSDDIEIGCGGTVLRLLEEFPHAMVHWVVMAAAGARRTEAQRSADSFLAGCKRKQVLLQQEFKDGFFPYSGERLKEFFEALKRECAPDVIFTHYRADLHQDHRIVSELTWNTFRDHAIFEYEIMKYDGDLGNPNFYVQLEERQVSKKIDLLMDCFSSQRSKQWFTPDTFRSLLRLRGVESNARERHAEAFYARKLRY
jgi:LmbE family N-acetylglucosaminyl deacetylase